MKTKRNLWPVGIFATFGIFFVAMAGVVVIAATHRDGLVSANYYEQELKFQSQIENVARGQKSGATIRLEETDGKIVVSVPVAQMAEKFSGTIQLYRPSAPGLDRELKLTPNNYGTQSLDISKLAPGAWHVRVTWNARGQEYFLEEKIKI